MATEVDAWSSVPQVDGEYANAARLVALLFTAESVSPSLLSLLERVCELPVGPWWRCFGSSPLSLHAREGLQQAGLATPPCALLMAIARSKNASVCARACVRVHARTRATFHTVVVFQLFTFNSFSRSLIGRGEDIYFRFDCLLLLFPRVAWLWLDGSTLFFIPVFLSCSCDAICLLVGLCVTMNCCVLYTSQSQTST